MHNEAGSSQQFRKLPGNALSEIKDFFNDVADLIEEFRKDTRYCPGGHIREDLKPMLRMDPEPKKRLLDEFWRELEA